MKNTKYVFYDIECANCRNYTAKISNFGYVITDCEFNIIESKERAKAGKTLPAHGLCLMEVIY